MSSFEFFPGAIQPQKDVKTLPEDVFRHSEFLHDVLRPQNRLLVQLSRKVNYHRRHMLLLELVQQQTVEQS